MEKFNLPEENSLDSFESNDGVKKIIKFTIAQPFGQSSYYDSTGFPKNIRREDALLIVDEIIRETEGKIKQKKELLEKMRSLESDLSSKKAEILRGEIPITYRIEHVVRFGGSEPADNKWDTYDRVYTYPEVDHYTYEINLGTKEVKLIQVESHSGETKILNQKSNDSLDFPYFADYKTARFGSFQKPYGGRGDISEGSSEPFKTDEVGFGVIDEETVKLIKSRMKKYKNALKDTFIFPDPYRYDESSGLEREIEWARNTKEKINNNDETIEILKNKVHLFEDVLKKKSRQDNHWPGPQI